MGGFIGSATSGAPEITAAWLTFLAQLLATLVGGGLVILANNLTDRSRQRAEDNVRDEHHRVVLTGIFSVRNFVFAHINRLEPSSTWSALVPLASALRQVNVIVEKARPEDQALMMTLTDIQLALDALVATVGSKPRGRPLQHAAARRQINEVLEAFETFDVVSSGSLAFLSDEEIAVMNARSGS